MEDVAEPCSIVQVKIETELDKVAFGVFMLYTRLCYMCTTLCGYDSLLTYVSRYWFVNLAFFSISWKLYLIYLQNHILEQSCAKFSANCSLAAKSVILKNVLF